MSYSLLRYVSITFALSVCIGTLSADELVRIRLLDLAGKPIQGAVLESDVLALDPKPSADDTYVMDQKNFQFSPRVLVIPPGASVDFPNSDDSRHHVYSFSEPKSFEIQLYAGNQAEPVRFDREGVVALGCNIHDRMSAHIYVTSAAIAEVSDKDGQVVIPPHEAEAGSELLIWHPSLSAPLVFSMDDFYTETPRTISVTLPVTLSDEDAEAPESDLRKRLKSYRSDDG